MIRLIKKSLKGNKKEGQGYRKGASTEGSQGNITL
jgi:hypothetical protein